MFQTIPRCIARERLRAFLAEAFPKLSATEIDARARDIRRVMRDGFAYPRFLHISHAVAEVGIKQRTTSPRPRPVGAGRGRVFFTQSLRERRHEVPESRRYPV